MVNEIETGRSTRYPAEMVNPDEVFATFEAMAVANASGTEQVLRP
jgi:hypothetical protein